jgi:hypothetical protein
MTMDRAAVLEVLEAMKSAGVDERIRLAATTIDQALIDVELTRRPRHGNSAPSRPGCARRHEFPLAVTLVPRVACARQRTALRRANGPDDGPLSAGRSLNHDGQREVGVDRGCCWLAGLRPGAGGASLPATSSRIIRRGTARPRQVQLASEMAYLE